MPKTVAQYQWAATSYSNVQGDSEAKGMAFSGLLDCIDEMNLHVWAFQVSGTTITFIPGQSGYAAPANYRAPFHFSYDSNTAGVGGQFDPVGPKEFEVRQAQQASTTLPKYYTVKSPYPSGVITLSQPADAAFVNSYPTGEFFFYSRVPYPTATTDVIDVPPEVEQYLLWNLRAQLAVTYAIEKAQFAQTKADLHFEQARINHRDDEVFDWR